MGKRRILGIAVGAVAIVATACFPYDFDADSKADHVFMDEVGDWYFAGDPDPFFARSDRSGDFVPVPGDYDGDGNWEAATFTPSGWETDGDAGIIEWIPWEAHTIPSCPASVQTDEYFIPGNYGRGPAFEPAWYDGCTATWYFRGRAPIQYGIGANSAPPY